MKAPTLYERVLGPNYDCLPSAVQRFHRLTGRVTLHGRVETRRPGSALARILALCLGLPREPGDGPLRFELDAAADAETWVRHFPGRMMSSTLRWDDGRLAEVLGPVRFGFRLEARANGLRMELERVRVLGVPCPRWLMPRVTAVETGDEDLMFDVSAELPGVGLVAGYRGHLALPSQVDDLAH